MRISFLINAYLEKHRTNAGIPEMLSSKVEMETNNRKCESRRSPLYNPNPL